MAMEPKQAKGHVISEQNYGVLNFPKMQQNYWISATKIGQIRKIKTHYHVN